MHALTDAYTWSRAHRDDVVASAQRDRFARPPGFYESYYGKLNFAFHVAAQNGLAAFCRELFAIGAIDALFLVVPGGGRCPSLASLLDRAAAGGRLSFEEGVRLYNEADLHELGAAAHARRMQMHPRDVVTYVIDTTINYTNVCNVHCTFCAFFRPEHHKEGYTMSHDKVLERVKYAVGPGRDADHDSRRRQSGAGDRLVRNAVRPRAARISRTSTFIRSRSRKSSASRTSRASRRARCWRGSRTPA